MIASVSRINKPRHPCDVQSRWRRHSFTADDYQDYLSVSQVDPNGPVLLFSVNGIPRTLVTTSGVPPGDYFFCWWTEEYVGGVFAIYPVDGGDCIDVPTGNPPLLLTDDIIAQYPDTIQTMSLPARANFDAIDPVLYGSYAPDFYGGAGIISKVSISDPLCDVLPTGDFGHNLIGTFPNGQQWYYDARILLDENTVENPIPDGGGANALAGTLCPNVPKTFLNRKSNNCVIRGARWNCCN